MEKRKKELEKEKIELNNKIKKEINPTIQQQLNNRKIEISNLENKINQYFQHLESIKELNKISIKSHTCIDEEKYKTELLELKKAIRIMQKLRDSFEHRNDKFNINNNTLFINNEKNKFKVSIPKEYLEGFCKGRIIVKEEDKYIIELTNKNTYPLLEELEYDPKKLESFFYNVEPSYLAFLLEKVNYNVKELYKIPDYIFSGESITKYLLKKLDFKTIIKLPVLAFFRPDTTIELHEKGIDVFKLPRAAFYYPKATIELYEKGIDISKLPDIAFEHPDTYSKATIELYKKGIDVFKLTNEAFNYPEGAIELHEKGIDISKLPPAAFCYPKATIELQQKGIDLSKLPWIAFHYPKATIELYEKGLDISKLPDIAFNYPKATIELYEKGIDISKLPDIAFYYPKATIELHEKGIDIYKLPHRAFEHPEGTIELHEKGIDIYNFLRPSYAYDYPKATIELHEKGIDVSKLLPVAFYYPKATIELYEKGIDVSKLSTITFRNPKATIELYEKGIDIYNFLDTYTSKLQEIAFEHPETTIELYKKGIDIYKIPDIAFEHPETTIELYKKGIDIYKISKSSFNSPAVVIELYKKGIDIPRLPKKVLDRIASSFKNTVLYSGLYYKNIEYLLEKVNYDYEKLNQFPIEFFECDINLLDEMLSRYNYNLCRSIFGIDNPKMISLLIYMNSVFSHYNKDMTNSINFDTNKFIELGIDNTYKYKNNITENNITRDTYINQFIINENMVKKNPKIVIENYTNNGYRKNVNGEYYNPNLDEYDESYNPNTDALFKPRRNISEVKEYIISKLRNSSAHFRFKIVKDKEGKIIEDKIYLYDEDKNGNNFNIILNINDLLEITRTIEVEINRTKNNTKPIQNNNNKQR